mmetsp:Transcript_29255/g.41055  ORF Transcript_29255/g.41055 Transcript_29255/m.41055 type:complete len:399 (-) Transcript_29255:402-1598(-)|eukprot:CAMPEP_0175101812 /NCGR_PEP_ID=MMETSP0086_2-20121207/8045_1 /TAXON_ID=136419 /ORGANISM="Unknown Unknown, Strain D1" /LENGTH=398 /DNA_ID=CAMNT_0016376465 /DNA_START=314 /DNA_END=1510 /DNA_ORIENTATION=+
MTPVKGSPQKRRDLCMVLSVLQTSNLVCTQGKRNQTDRPVRPVQKSVENPQQSCQACFLSQGNQTHRPNCPVFSFWFGHEDAKHCEIVMRCYAKFLSLEDSDHSHSEQKKSSRAPVEFIGRIKRWRLNDLNDQNVLECVATLDAVEVYQRENVQWGSEMKKTSTAILQTRWDSDGFPISFQRKKILDVTLSQSLPSSDLYCLPVLHTHDQYDYFSTSLKSVKKQDTFLAGLPFQSASSPLQAEQGGEGGKAEDGKTQELEHEIGYSNGHCHVVHKTFLLLGLKSCVSNSESSCKETGGSCTRLDVDRDEGVCAEDEKAQDKETFEQFEQHEQQDAGADMLADEQILEGALFQLNADRCFLLPDNSALLLGGLDPDDIDYSSDSSSDCSSSSSEEEDDY